MVSKLFQIFILAVSVILFLAAPARAQFSDAYNFIKELKDGNMQAAREAFTLDVSPNARDGDGIPVLVIAADQRSLEMVTFLLDQGAYVDVAGRDRGETALMRFALQGNVEGINLLVERGADVDQPDKAGETALIKAVLANRSRSVRVLLEHGASPDLADYKGRSAYDYAYESRSRSLRRMLEDAVQ